MRWIVFTIVAACSAAPTPDDSLSSCPQLEGRTFASVTQGECGLGPNGPAPCTWHLTFTAVGAQSSTFSWQHSDYGVSGTAQCMDADVIGTDAGATYTGSFDAATETLTWEGVAYTPS